MVSSGITFLQGGEDVKSPKHALKELLSTPCNDMWIGFDCGHSYDSVDIEGLREYWGDEFVADKKDYLNAMSYGGYTAVRDFSYVEKECLSIIDQLIRVTGDDLSPTELECC